MCVPLSPDVVITSFYSTIAEKIGEQGREFDDIFKIRFRPERIIEFAYNLQHFDDVRYCFDKEALIHLFGKKKWESLFCFDKDGYIQLRKNENLAAKDNDYVRPIVMYLVYQLKPQLNKYPSGFLRKAGIY